MRAFAVFLALWFPVVVVVFLWLSGFFTSWHGHAVSVRSAKPDQVVHQVLVVDDAGSRFEDHWPVEVLQGIDLAIDPRAVPPTELPEGLPRTEKERFTMSFTLTPDGGVPRVISTATPQTLGLALLLFVLGALGRNMMVAGNPLSLEPRGVELVKAQRPPGSVGPSGDEPSTSKRRRTKKGPPPPKRRRGTGRRR